MHDSASNTAASNEFNVEATTTSGEASAAVFDLPRPAGGTLKWIPKGARLAASNVLIKLLQAVTSRPDDLAAWKSLLGVAGMAFVKPQRGGKSRNFTSLVLRQLHSYESDTTATPALQQRPKPFKRKVNDDETATAKRAASKLEEGDVRGAIRLLCSMDTIAAPNDESLDKLRHLHPATPSDRRKSPSTTVPPLTVSEGVVKASIMSFPCGSAGGPDGLRPQHLKDMLSRTDDTGPLLSSITTFVNLLLSGKVPNIVRPFLFGGSITALNKKGGGVRPIAVGCTWRRLAAKVCCRSVSERASRLLSPRQLGFGVKGGAEAAAHAARQYVENLTPEKALVKVDFSNAFNTLRRDTILEAVGTHFPELLPFASSTYDESSRLHFGKFTFSSSEGAQQGDPLGPLYFCLAIHSLLSSLESEFVCGYLDDITIGDEVDIIEKDFIKLEQDAANLGLKLNRSKCEIIASTDNPFNELHGRGISLIQCTTKTACLLGAPLFKDGVDQALTKKCDELKAMTRRLLLLPAHDSLYLLRNALAIPKLLYILRTAPCFSSVKLIEYDETLRISLQSILNVALDETCWRQASLPIWAGGLGMRSAVMLAPSAFIASAAGTAPLVSSLLPAALRNVTSDNVLMEAKRVWRTMVPSTTMEPTGALMSRQRFWDAPCCASIANDLLAHSSNQSDRARLLASRASWSGDWLNALPLASIGLKLDDQSVRIAIALRLGAHVVHPHACVCGAPVEANGFHGLHCKLSAGRQSRHANVNELLQRAFVSAGVAAVREPNGLCASDNRRPDGVTLVPWGHGKCLVWDFTCPDTLAPSHTSTTSTTAGAAANSAEAAKTAKYSDLSNNYEVAPIAIETLGVWGQGGKRLIQALGSRIAAATKEPRACAFLRQRIAVAVQRGNASAVLGTHRHLTGLGQEVVDTEPL